MLLKWSILCLTVALALHSSYGASTWIKRQVNEPAPVSSQRNYIAQPFTEEEYKLLADRTKTALQKDSSPAEFAKIVVDYLKQNLYNVSEDILTNPGRNVMFDVYQQELEERVETNPPERAEVAENIISEINNTLAKIESEKQSREEYEAFAKGIKAELLKKPNATEYLSLLEKYLWKNANLVSGSVEAQVAWDQTLIELVPGSLQDYTNGLIEKIDKRLAEYEELDKQMKLNKKE